MKSRAYQVGGGVAISVTLSAAEVAEWMGPVGNPSAGLRATFDRRLEQALFTGRRTDLPALLTRMTSERDARARGEAVGGVSEGGVDDGVGLSKAPGSHAGETRIMRMAIDPHDPLTDGTPTEEGDSSS